MKRKKLSGKGRHEALDEIRETLKPIVCKIIECDHTEDADQIAKEISNNPGNYGISIEYMTLIEEVGIHMFTLVEKVMIGLADEKHVFHPKDGVPDFTIGERFGPMGERYFTVMVVKS